VTEAKLVIFGSRDFDDYELLERWVDTIRNTYSLKVVELVSGTARGADKLGELWAATHVVPITPFPAEWGKYGKSAGYRRNAEMAEYATHAIGFWDGKSKGTKHMIDLCHRADIPTWVVSF